MLLYVNVELFPLFSIGSILQLFNIFSLPSIHSSHKDCYKILMKNTFVIRMTLVDTGALLTSGQLSSKHVWFVLCQDPMVLTHTLMNYVSVRNGFEYKNIFWCCPYRISVIFLFHLFLLFTEDVFLMNSKDPKNPIVYGVFTTSRYGMYYFTCIEIWCLLVLKRSLH